MHVDRPFDVGLCLIEKLAHGPPLPGAQGLRMNGTPLGIGRR